MAAPQPVLVLPESRPAEVLAARYSHVRRVSLDDLRAAADRGFRRAEHAGREPGQVASRAHQLVLRAVPAQASAAPAIARSMPDFEYLFNSYYQAVGRMHERPQRGLLTRPTVAEVLQLSRARGRAHAEAVRVARPEDERLADARDARAQSRAAASGADADGHQAPVLAQSAAARVPCRRAERSERRTSAPLRFISFDGGIREIGASGKHFCFDNEMPRHRMLVEPYALADRLVTNGEYLRIHARRRLSPAGVLAVRWLEHGHSEGWTRPIYWSERSIASSRCTGCSRSIPPRRFVI